MCIILLMRMCETTILAQQCVDIQKQLGTESNNGWHRKHIKCVLLVKTSEDQ